MMENQVQGFYGVAITSDSLLFAIIILSGFLALAILISMMRIYKKAGKPSISAIVPIWSQIVMFQIVDKPAWYIVLLLIPIVNVVILIQAYILLAKKFGKGTGFGIAMIFLPMIFIPLLSFYDYVDAQVKEEKPIYNPFKDNNVSQVMPAAPVSNISEAPLNAEGIEPAQNVDVSQGIPVVDANALVKEENVSETNDELLANKVEIPEVNPVVEHIDNINVVTPLNENNQIVTPMAGGQNPTIQDIESVLSNNNSINDPKNIAFGTVQNNIVNEENNVILQNPSVEQVNNVLEEKTEEILNVAPVSEEVIEMPSMAAKTCPACGVSLSDDVKFCTSCGTQL